MSKNNKTNESFVNNIVVNDIGDELRKKLMDYILGHLWKGAITDEKADELSYLVGDLMFDMNTYKVYEDTDAIDDLAHELFTTPQILAKKLSPIIEKNNHLFKYTVQESNSDEVDVKVTFEDGSDMIQKMAAHLTEDEIKDYFKPGSITKVGDDMKKIVDVEIMNDNVNESILNESDYLPLRSVKVKFDKGGEITTNMAGHLSDEDIYDYYKIGRYFNIGNHDDDVQKVVEVEILDDEPTTERKMVLQESSKILRFDKFQNINEQIIPNVGRVDDFELKDLLLKNDRVLNILTQKELDFASDEKVDVIGVSGKNYDFIFTDGKQEFEIINQKPELKLPLREARPEIVEFYSSNSLELQENSKIIRFDSFSINENESEDFTSQERPIRQIEKEVFEYLNELRDSGVTNMYGAVPYIMEEFPKLQKHEASVLLSSWMKNFREDGNYETIKESTDNELLENWKNDIAEIEMKKNGEEIMKNANLKTCYVPNTSWFDREPYYNAKEIASIIKDEVSNIRFIQENGMSNQPEVVVFDCSNPDKVKAMLNKHYNTEWIHVKECEEDWCMKQTNENKKIKENMNNKFKIERFNSFKANESFDDYEGTEDEYLLSPEYFVETYYNGNFSQLKTMYKEMVEQGKKAELISYLREMDNQEIINWIVDNF